MTNTTLTQYTFFKAVAEGNITDEVKAFAKNKVKADDEKKAERRKANKQVRDDILKALNEATEPVQAKVIAEEIGNTAQKVSTVLRELRADNLVKVVDDRTPLLYEIIKE